MGIRGMQLIEKLTSQLFDESCNISRILASKLKLDPRMIRDITGESIFAYISTNNKVDGLE